MRTLRRKVKSASLHEFVVDANDSAFDPFAIVFADWLEKCINSRTTFSNIQTLQYGFSLLQCKVEAGILRLLAPDFSGMPIQWESDLGRPLSIMAIHKYMAETFGFEPNIPSMLNTVIVGRRFEELPMIMNRSAPLDSNANDSGWFVGSSSDDVNNNDPAQLRHMSLYELVLTVPCVLDFLSLPVGCQVVFSGGNPVVLQDYKELEIPPGSYLDQKLKMQ